MKELSKKFANVVSKAARPMAMSMKWPPDCALAIHQPKRPESLRRHSDPNKK